MSSASFPIVRAYTDSPPAITGVRLRAIVDAEHDFVWRSVRRLGVEEADVDDAVQKVFLVMADRLDGVDVGRERAFLFATAVRVASNERRAVSRKRSAGPAPLEGLVAEGRSPEAVAVDRSLLDALLDALPIEQRSVLVLAELEQMTAEEIAAILGVPVGTIASRLRRARQLVQIAMKRLHAQEERR